MNYKENKKWSSPEDFEKGDIIADGVILGKTKLQDLRNMGLDIFTEENETRGGSKIFSAYLGETRDVTVLVSRYTHKDLEEKSRRYKNASSYNKDAILQMFNTVFVISLDCNWTECPLISAMGLEVREDDEIDFVELSDLIEEKGYLRIENLEEMADGCIEFVNAKPNSNGDYIFVTLDTNQEMIFLSINKATTCTSYVTGETIVLQKIDEKNLVRENGIV